jgi:hypothetical protein
MCGRNQRFKEGEIKTENEILDRIGEIDHLIDAMVDQHTSMDIIELMNKERITLSWVLSEE